MPMIVIANTYPRLKRINQHCPPVIRPRIAGAMAGRNPITIPKSKLRKAFLEIVIRSKLNSMEKFAERCEIGYKKKFMSTPVVSRLKLNKNLTAISRKIKMSWRLLN